MKQITDLNEITVQSEEGRLLFVALSLITTTNRTDKTPSEVLSELNEMKQKNFSFVDQKHNLDFGQAIQALKQGKRVARTNWNGKGLFVFMQVPAEIPIETVPKMQSLPQSVKDRFIARHSDAEKELLFEVDPILRNTIRYKNQLAIVYPDNTISGWVPSVSDVLEEDWCILD